MVNMRLLTVRIRERHQNAGWYAGWAAVGLSRSGPLADAVRASRDSGLRGGGRRRVLHRTLAILARTAVYTRPFYAPLRRLREGELAGNPPANGRRKRDPADWTGNRSQSPEWYLPSTRIDRSLAVSNAHRREWLWGAVSSSPAATASDSWACRA